MGEFRLNAFTNGGQYSPDIAALAGGGFVAVWTDGKQDSPGVNSSDGVYARVFDDDGKPMGAEFRVHSGKAGDQGAASVAALKDGGFAVSWSSDGPNASGVDDPYNDAYLRIFDADGGARTPGVQITASHKADHFVSDLEALPDGSFIAVTQGSNVATNWKIEGLHVSAQGQQIGQSAVLEPSAYTGTSSNSANTSPGVSITSQPNGSYLMTWWEEVRGSSGGTAYAVDRVFARAFDEDGDPLGPKQAVTDFSTNNDKSFPHATALPGGKFAVAWTEETDAVATGNDVHFRIVGPNGAPLTKDLLVNAGDRADDQSVSDVTHLGQGLTLITYSSFNEDASPFPNDYFDIKGRIFGADGKPVSDVFTFSDAPRNEQGGARVEVLDSGELIFAFENGGLLNEDVFGSIIDVGASVAGTKGDDVVRGGLLKELLTGGDGDDRILAGAGDDRLLGGRGLDSLYGQDGEDQLTGGAGQDQLFGGEGADRFVFETAKGKADIVRDFHGAGAPGPAAQRDTLVIDASVYGGVATNDFDVVNGRTQPDAPGDGPAILYARASGNVFFDPDGRGGDDAVLVATLKDGPDNLRIGDIDLI